MKHYIQTVIVTSLLVMLSTASAAAQPLRNPSFDDPQPTLSKGEAGSATAVCDEPRGAVGVSASEHWTLFGNTVRTSVNSWLTIAPGGYTSNLVAVGGDQGGIVQVLAAQNTPTSYNRVGVWVYVVAGQAFVQIGNGGSGGGATQTSTHTGQWELLTACGRSDMLNNEIIVYSIGGPAVFYVDDAWVTYDSSC